ncbi:hypothetical protein Tsp_06877 [Trichinella spiralis]|uniref:hypothetical protein n=1 Tax=Trichinella spiralis TaxID=6334 RepID=UPI0001EFCBEC|nr:hypothetical protein Tsp_06877 [Trichinella spiralis]
MDSPGQVLRGQKKAIKPKFCMMDENINGHVSLARYADLVAAVRCSFDISPYDEFGVILNFEFELLMKPGPSKSSAKPGPSKSSTRPSTSREHVNSNINGMQNLQSQQQCEEPSTSSANANDQNDNGE